MRVRIAAAVLCDQQGRTILVRGPGAHDEVVFSRMWQFPAVEIVANAEKELARHVGETLGAGPLPFRALSPMRHGVTFRNITLLPFLAQVTELPKGPRTRTAALRRLHELPVSSATRKIAAAAMLSLR